MLLAKDLHLILLYMVETCDYFNTFYFLTAVFLFCKAHLISCYCRTGLDEVSQLLCFSFLFFSLSIYMAYPWSFHYFSSWNFYLRTVIWFELTELRIKQIIDTSWSNSIVNQHVYGFMVFIFDCLQFKMAYFGFERNVLPIASMPLKRSKNQKCAFIVNKCLIIEHLLKCW